MNSIFFINDFDYFYSHRFLLLKELNRCIKVGVACDTSLASEDALKNCKRSNIQIIHVKNTAKDGLLGKLIQCKSQLNVVKKFNPKNVLFVTLESSVIGMFISLLERRTSFFFLITGFGPFFSKNEIKYAIFRWMTFLLIKISNSRSKYIVQNTDDNKFLKNKVKNIILISGNGICTETFRFKKRNTDLPSFLFLSRLVKSKGVDTFIEAAEKISKNNIKALFSLGGIYDPLNPESIEPSVLNKIKNHPNVNYLGAVERKNIVNALHSSDIFILGSEREGMPQAILEAAATGMPIIASDVPGSRECIKDNGMLFKYGDVNSLIECIQMYINDTDKVELHGIKSRELIINNFEIKVITNKYLKILQNSQYLNKR